MYQDRANQITPKIIPHLKIGKVLDIGCGTGAIARTIKKKKKVQFTLVDVTFNPMCDIFPVMIYDGRKLPFPNKSFDNCLLITVLHHSNTPQEVLDEAIRVTSGRIIVIEDIFSDLFSRIITFLGDCLVNWEIHSPFLNHSLKEWISIFSSKGLKINYVEEFNLKCVGLSFKLGVFVLDQKSKD